jgi:hypothetical protein
MKNMVMFKTGEHAWITYIKNRIRSNLNFLATAEGSTGIGKTQPKGNKVLMANGKWKDVSEIQIGDLVISPQKNGEYSFAKVIEIHQRFEKDIYELYEQNRKGRVLYSCAGNHIIPYIKTFSPRVRDKNGKIKNKRNYTRILGEKEASELFKLKSMKGGNSNTNSLFTTTAIEFTQSDETIDPYFLGAFLGDGSFNNSSFSICLGKSKINILNEIKKIITIRKKIEKKNSKGTYSYYFNIKDDLALKLKELGLYGKKAGTKFIPKSCLLSSINYRTKLLAGLIDTDGFVSKNNCIEYATKSKQLAEDIFFLVHSLGGYSPQPKKIKKKAQNGFEGTYYSLTISFQDPTFLPLETKKLDRLSKRKYNPRNIKFQIRKIKSQKVYGFELDKKETDSHWFITNNFMITHNSWAMLSVAYQIDPTFEIRQVAFSFQEVMEILNADWFKKKKWKIIFFDEPQTDISNRTWQSITNRLLNYLISTFRHQNCILLFATPYSDFIDSQTQKLLHCKFVIKSHSRKTKLTTIRPKLQQYNSKMKKFYEHSLMVSSKKGVFKMTQWKVPKPPQLLIDPYEEKKLEFTSELNKDILIQLEKVREKNKPVEKVEEKPDNTHLLNAEYQDWYHYIKEHPNKKQTEYAKVFGVSQGRVSTFYHKCDSIGANVRQFVGNRAKS